MKSSGVCFACRQSALCRGGQAQVDADEDGKLDDSRIAVSDQIIDVPDAGSRALISSRQLEAHRS